MTTTIGMPTARDAAPGDKERKKKPSKRRVKAAPYRAPPTCLLPYGADGRWSAQTLTAAKKCVFANLERSLEWWRSGSCEGGPRLSLVDIDASLCRIRALGPRQVLTNMMLLQSVGGRMSAKILLDPADERGPMRHWPARPVAAIQQLAVLQDQIDSGRLPQLPDFVAVLNPHDAPYQSVSRSWCGLAPLLSNSRVDGLHHDLLMPDFSFAPISCASPDLPAAPLYTRVGTHDPTRKLPESHPRPCLSRAAT